MDLCGGVVMVCKDCPHDTLTGTSWECCKRSELVHSLIHWASKDGEFYNWEAMRGCMSCDEMIEHIATTTESPEAKRLYGAYIAGLI